MESKILFSCAYKDNLGKGHILARELDTTTISKDQMLTMLNHLKCFIGKSRLEIDPEPDIGPARLTVEYDGEKYLFDLLEFKDDGSASVRMPLNVKGEQGLTYFRGELFPGCQVITDFDFIKKVFVEFLETRNVSYDLMA